MAPTAPATTIVPAPLFFDFDSFSSFHLCFFPDKCLLYELSLLQSIMQILHQVAPLGTLWTASLLTLDGVLNLVEVIEIPPSLSSSGASGMTACYF